MKYLRLLLLVIACAAWPSLAHSQGVLRSLNAANSVCTASSSACLLLTLPNNTGSVSIAIGGTFTATAQFEATTGPNPSTATWVSLNCIPVPTGDGATAATAPGTWQCNVAAFYSMRVRVSAYTSGTMNVRINPSVAVAKSVFGGGSGGSGNLSGTLTATKVPVAQSANALIDSQITDTGSLITLPGNVNLSALSASKCVRTDGSKNLVSAAADCGGGSAVTPGAGSSGFTEGNVAVADSGGALNQTTLSYDGTDLTINGAVALTEDSTPAFPSTSGNTQILTYNDTTPPGTLATATIPRAISFSIGDPGGSALSAASTTTAYVTVPFACTITAYNLLIDAGTITVKFWRKATGTAIPTSSDSINTSGVAIASGTAIHSATVSDFTSVAIAANDIVAMNVTTVDTAKFINGVLQCNETVF